MLMAQVVSARAHNQACKLYWTSRMTINLEDLFSVKPTVYLCVCASMYIPVVPHKAVAEVSKIGNL